MVRRKTALLAVALLFVAAALQGQTPAPELTQAPLNPHFVEHMAAREQGLIETFTADGHALGSIPSTLDLSHLQAQQAGARLSMGVPPASYDLRTLNRVSPVRDQGSCGSCWAFATFGSMESNLMPGETLDFSENNLKNLHGWDWSPCAGGMWQMSAAYLARWAGPVYESDDPYQPSDVNTSPAGLPARKHVQDIILIAQRSGPMDNDNIKNAVMNHGGVDVSMFWWDGSYNASTKSYYYNGPTTLNHDITVVGWDDNYSAANFLVTPAGNGAFLIKNSWGTYWGLGGFFWLSYYDTSFGNYTSAVFSGNQPVTNYTRKYEYDPLGWTTSMGYPTPPAWFANVFIAQASEQLQAWSTYVASDNSPYTVQIYTGVTGAPTSGTLQQTSSGTFAQAGYHTVSLAAPVSLTAGQKFSVVVQLTTPGYDYPVPVEYRFVGSTSRVTASPGQSYMSSDGTSWRDTTTIDSATNVCLKAFSAGPQETAVSFTPNSLVGGNSATGTLTLAAAAPAGGGTILLSSNTTAVRVPQTVTVPTGTMSTTFTATTNPVGIPTLATITAGAVQTTLTVNPVAVSTVVANPTTVLGGSSATVTVVLAAVAPAGGATILLSSNNTAVQVPQSVTVPAGAMSTAFTATTSVVDSQVQAIITANTAQATLTVNPIAVSSVSLTPATVLAGNSATGTITLAAAALSGGRTVAMSSSNAAVQVPQTVTVPAGSLSATFTATTSVVGSQVLATIHADTAQTILTVNPVPVITRLSSANVQAGAAGFTLAITGRGFANGARVSWNGSDRGSSTIWDDSSDLRLVISAADVASAGVVDLMVTNPASAGGVASNSFEFVIDTPSGGQGAFTISSTTATLNVKQGQSASLQVSFTGTKTGAQITATCVNLPVGASCSYSNGSVTITTSSTTPPGSYNIVVIFTATQQLAGLRRHRIVAAAWLGVSACPLGLLWLSCRRRSLLRCLVLTVILAVLLLPASCGGGAGAPPIVTTQSSMSLAVTVN